MRELSKRCPKCKKVKMVKEFCKRAESPTGYQSYCKRCVSKYMMTRYKKNPEEFAKNNKKYKEIGTEYIVAYLKERPCIDCGDTRLPVLEFDHLPEFKKMYTIAILARKGNIKLIQAEIAKCDVVCSNCHKVRHSVRDKWKYKV